MRSLDAQMTTNGPTYQTAIITGGAGFIECHLVDASPQNYIKLLTFFNRRRVESLQ